MLYTIMAQPWIRGTSEKNDVRADEDVWCEDHPTYRISNNEVMLRVYVEHNDAYADAVWLIERYGRSTVRAGEVYHRYFVKSFIPMLGADLAESE